MKGNAGRPKPACLRCHRFVITITDGLNITELQREILQIIHRGHE